jgi:hypothetical protein
MKSAAAHVVPLAAPVLAILESLPRFGGGDYLFTSTGGAKSISGFNRAKHALDAKMLAELGELAPFVIHDIRRSVRTGLSALPVPDLIRELVIGHTKPGLHKKSMISTPTSMRRGMRSNCGLRGCKRRRTAGA